MNLDDLMSLTSEGELESTPANETDPRRTERKTKKSKSRKKARSNPTPSSASHDESENAVETISFHDLGLDPQIVQTVEARGYQTPTSVQERVIPSMLAGRDVLAQSQTGSGKTAAFALPILSKLDVKPERVQTLVLTPTRELAIQVTESFERYAESLENFRALAIYGGQDYEHQFRFLRRGVNVVVGTPGRVIDHIKRGTLDLSSLGCLVLDEADEMLNMGFLEDVEFVLEQTPANRQITLFSATMPDAIRRIADTYLVDPETVTIKRKQVTAESIVQRAVIVTPKAKIVALTRFLEVEPTDGVIVFTKTKDSTSRVSEQLIRHGFSATALNGDMPQRVRERAIEQLKEGKLDILVATDVAARGLDVSRISHVFNFDLPHDSESYIHRIGRTGRAGREGHAIIFLTPAQRRKLRLIEKATRQPIKVVSVPDADQINAIRVTKLKESLGRIISVKDLEFFRGLVNSFAEESGHSAETIAAAMAELAQNGRSFLVTDRREFVTSDRGDSAGERSSRKRERRSGQSDERRRIGPPESGMIRYRIEVGRNDGVAPRNIVGAVANEAGIESEFIGPIKIYPHFSTIDLPEGMPKDVFQTLQRTWVSGKQLRIRPDRGPGQRDSGRRGSDQSGGAPGRTGTGQRGSGKRRSSHRSSEERSTGRGGSHGGGKDGERSGVRAKARRGATAGKKRFGKPKKR